MWGAKSCLIEAIYERSQWFTLFLPNAQEGDCGSLVWTAASKMGGEHVGKNVEAVDGVRRKGCEPFQGDMGDVDFEVLVRVGFASIAV